LVQYGDKGSGRRIAAKSQMKGSDLAEGKKLKKKKGKAK